MTTINNTYPWQQVANQGKELYGKMNGKTVIGPGSSEAIEQGINLLASDNKPVQLAVAQKDMKLPNLWDGGYNYPKKGDIVMTYGPQSTEYMAGDWQSYASKHGRKTLIDRNYSVAPKVMETTYIDAKTGEFLTGRLHPENKEIITGLKRSNTGFAFFPEGTPVLSTEALKNGKAPTLSKPFQAVALDAEGCYLTPFKTLKKYKGTDAVSTQAAKKAQQALRVADNAQKYLSEGLISEARATASIKNAWKSFLNIVKNLK